MRTHGWGGSPPASDAEAVARIKDATHRCVRELGGATTIAHVAADLGISRQTVYRYFPSTDAMLTAAAFDGTRDFLARLSRRLRSVTDPGEALVESVAYTIQEVPREPYLRLLLDVEGGGSLLRSVTSDTARTIGRSLLDQSAVDWDASGIGPGQRAELIEWTLRTVQSFLVDPGDPARSPDDLRRFLRRWFAPAVAASAALAVSPPATTTPAASAVPASAVPASAEPASAGTGSRAAS